ncbi:MAG: hypothetical protein J6S51_04605 [Kiritimatiellae bacterium]|nr:hypothetical protein [Kiritimatiellia bacterium]
MKYIYCYQTKENENRRGEINARDRADAYRLLRKQGIRPYRIIGDDPIKWQPWALGAAFLVLLGVCVVSLTLLFSGKNEVLKDKPIRCQILGEKTLIVKAFSEGWVGVFKLPLDCVLAMYAQPGWAVIPQEFSDSQIETYEKNLAEEPSLLLASIPEYEEALRIVTSIRAELKTHVLNGGGIRDFLHMLDKRQELESSLRAKAYNSVLNANPTLRDAMLKNMNERLSAMGMATLENDLGVQEK